jgi:hypothetical protein
VAELARADVAVVLCSAAADALDGLIAPGHGAREMRTAPDEAMFVCDPAVAPDVEREVRDRIAALDADAVVLDVTDGWAGARLIGDDAAAAFAYVSRVDPPAPGAFVQGDVAHVGAKVLGDADGLTILVPAYWEAHLLQRVAEDARAMEVPA